MNVTTVQAIVGLLVAFSGSLIMISGGRAQVLSRDSMLLFSGGFAITTLGVMNVLVSSTLASQPRPLLDVVNILGVVFLALYGVVVPSTMVRLATSAMTLEVLIAAYINHLARPTGSRDSSKRRIE